MNDYVAETLVYAFPSAAGEIRARLRRRADGAVRADLRLFIADRSGTVVPTKSGVSVPAANLAELRRAVDALIHAAEAELEDAIADGWTETGEAGVG